MEEEKNNCPNCGQNEMKNYCPNCGEQRYKRIVMKDILGDFMSNLFSLEGQVLRTIKDLTIQPGIMIRSYLKGKRKVYYKPFQYYILAATLYFIFFFMWGDSFMEMFSNIGANANATATAEQINSLQQRMTEFQSENVRLFNALQIPLYAWFIWLFFGRKNNYNFTESMVASLYLTAQTLLFGIISSFLVLVNPSASIIMNIIFAFIYFPWVFKQLYHQKLLPTILKSWIIIIAVFILFGILMALISVVWIIITR